MTYAGEAIQVGWSVWASDGEELGTVVSTDPQTITVKQGGLLGGKLAIPRTAIEEVEEGRVELSITKSEAKSAS
jgi:hypothetical protein